MNYRHNSTSKEMKKKQKNCYYHSNAQRHSRAQNRQTLFQEQSLDQQDLPCERSCAFESQAAPAWPPKTKSTQVPGL